MKPTNLGDLQYGILLWTIGEALVEGEALFVVDEGWPPTSEIGDLVLDLATKLGVRCGVTEMSANGIQRVTIVSDPHQLDQLTRTNSDRVKEPRRARLAGQRVPGGHHEP